MSRPATRLKAPPEPATAVRRRGTERARMADVAQLAGVSASTVSRFLRQSAGVSPALGAKVRSAIEALSYVPNPMAGGLAASRSRSVGVIVPSLINSSFAATLDAMADALAPHGYQIMLGNSGYSADAEEALVQSFLAWSPAAIVLTGRTHSRATLQRLLSSGIPVVEMWELGDNPIDSLVGFSHRAVGRVAARHLIERGRRRIAFLGAALDEDRRAAQRSAGFAEAVQDLSRDPPIMHAVAARASTESGGRGLAQLLARYPDVDGVAFSNDALALGALFECQRRGIDVPGRLALIGFGDLDFSPWCRPSLSTIRPPRREIGTAVADHLLQRFGGAADAPATIDVGFELVAREST